MLLDINDIQKIIPHRYPFLLVDCVEEMEPGVRAVGYKNVTMNEPFFQGHFPQQPVMPGVLIIEALAQVGAIAVLSLPENKGKIAYFGAVDKCRFKGKDVGEDHGKSAAGKQREPCLLWRNQKCQIQKAGNSGRPSALRDRNY